MHEDPPTPPPVPASPSSPDADPLIGLWVLDQYQLVRLIARGGMGAVYLAEQSAMDRFAAVKILHARRETEWRNRFRQEARTASRLSHPHIVTVYNFGELADGSLFLAMEYVDGTSLGGLLERGPLPLGRAVALARQCASALAYAHDRKVIHRDFKPDNVMVAEVQGKAHAKVVDFGLARVTEEAGHTNTGALVGTPRYMSPEQWRGEPATSFSDQYALGMVIYELLAGRPALYSDNQIGYLHLHQHVMPAAPSTIRPAPEVAAFDGLVLRLLAKSPKARFPSLEEATAELARLELALGLQDTGGGGLARDDQEAFEERTPLPSEDLDTVSVRPGGAKLEPVATRAAGREQGAVRLALLGPTEPLKGADWGILARKHLRLAERCASPLDLKPSAEEPDLSVLPLPVTRWEEAWGPWAGAGVAPQRTLACFDGAPEKADVSEAAEQFPHLLVGARPLEPLAVGLALSWMARPDRSGIDQLPLDGAIQVIQITSSAQKAAYVDSLLDDARSEGVRQRGLRALTELAEEMIMNAIFDAPTAADGRPRYAQLDRAAELTLRPGEEATLRWMIGDRFIAVSIRDPFGALTPAEALGGTTGQARQPKLSGRGGGAGMGLRIMSRAARHLFFAICPGTWCEVLALVDREPDASALGRTVCVLNGLGQVARRVGDRLRLREMRQRDALHLELAGEINETSQLQPVFDPPGRVVLDLAGVTRMNSMGIRVWFEAARAGNPEQDLVFERCSMAVVSQLNLLPAFSETGRVGSILAPYVCGHCKKESLELLTRAELDATLPPARACESCHRPLVFDEVPEEYFAFLQEA
ncbi:MAG: protein kinase [Deltaproteobacteria bacterium]|nr:protein kinase [Deltaproteobacteria bacterium]